MNSRHTHRSRWGYEKGTLLPPGVKFSTTASSRTTSSNLLLLPNLLLANLLALLPYLLPLSLLAVPARLKSHA